MFREALLEVRHHPGRVAATIIAIAISIGFLAGISVFVRTQGAALGKQQAIFTTRTDVVVDLGYGFSETDTKDVARAIRDTEGVEAAEPSVEQFVPLSHDGRSIMVSARAVPGERFRWAELTEGTWATKPDQIVLTEAGADKLDVKVGDKVDVDDEKVTVTGLVDEPETIMSQSAYVFIPSGDLEDANPTTWMVSVKPGSDVPTVVDSLKSSLVKVKGVSTSKTDDGGLQVAPAQQYRADKINDLTGNFDAMKYMLMVFGAIALLVGVIIISTTFLILLAQRRRQIGLMRAVGASGSQLRRRVLGEAVVLGVIGSLCGIVLGILLALAGAAYTKALAFGMEWPWKDLLVEFGVGVLITVLAAFVPAIRSTRVAPLEALRPVPTTEARRKASIARITICSLMTIGGVAMCVRAMQTTKSSVGWAIGGSMLLALAILIAAPLYVPTLIKLLGLPLRPLGPTARLSTSNAVRNPTRTSLTAVALMLAVGLSVTLQVGVATTRSSVLDLINEYYPTDLAVSASSDGSMATAEGTPKNKSQSELPAGAITKVQNLPNLKATAVLKGGTVKVTAPGASAQDYQVLGANEDLGDVSPAVMEHLDDGVVLMSKAMAQFTEDSRVKLEGPSGTVELKAVPTRAISSPQQLMVSQATLAKLVDTPSDQAVWVALKDRSDFASTLVATQSITASYPGLGMDGGALLAGVIEQILNVLLIVMSALLGVAVLIALIGVANTLGLSVLERRRESALLRAMGMQRRDLRLMLLYESIQTGMVGVLIGLAGGCFFAWMGITSIFRTAGQAHRVHFAVDWWWLIGLLLICLAAASLASVLPGRRAARATPTEALADE